MIKTLESLSLNKNSVTEMVKENIDLIKNKMETNKLDSSKKEK